MPMRSGSAAACCSGVLLVVLCAVSPLPAQEGTMVEWPTYSGNLAGTRYSPLDQISADNFGDLEIAWRLPTLSFGPTPEYKFESTPLMVGGVVYTTAGTRRAVVAADATTGELLWMHRLDEGARGAAAPRRLSGRGLAYWDDGADGQIFYVTPGYQLVALHAKTGRPVTDFGTAGLVDLKQGLDQDIDPITGEIGLHAAPIVAGSTIIVGAAHLPGGQPATRENVKGYVRGFDARTGDRRWIFHTIPQGDEFGNDTWLGDSWRYTGNTGVWAQMSADLELGIAYLPVETPTGDYYGGHRHGDNLFSNSIVAVDLNTGERLWYFQISHHDVWDWDLPSAPVLADITVDGRPIKAVAQPTKQGWVFVFDRVTGEPVWPIEEQPVAASDVPGELLSPTQPFPSKPPALDRQGFGLDDVIDFTPELRAEAQQIVSRFRTGPIYTPPAIADPNGPHGTLIVPSQTGGGNWPGAALDPETGILYQYTKTQVGRLSLAHEPDLSTMDFVRVGRPRGVNPANLALNVQGLPLVKPPWGRISAVDLNRGDIIWQVAHGATPDHVRSHPALEGLDIPRTGQSGNIGTLVTKSLVIAGEPILTTTPEGIQGAMLRAYDKATGEEVAAVLMPAAQSGSPMTYMVDGIQYLVVAVSASGFPGELVAFRLPQPASGN